MSPIGRIFVVLNIVLAAVIFGVAASFLAKNDNYRFRYEEAVRDKDKTTADLEAERDAINEQRQAAERLRDQTITEKTQLENQKAALEDDDIAEAFLRRQDGSDEARDLLRSSQAVFETIHRDRQRRTRTR